MDFTVERTDFPSAIHKNIYFTARCVTPLEYSLPGVEDEALRESCRQYHAFVMTLFSDMYDDPGAYELPVGQLEEFCCGRKINGMKQKYPGKAKSVLAQMRNSVHGYLYLLCILGKNGELHGEVLTIPPEAMAEAKKRVNTSVSPIPLEKRLRALERIGLAKTEDGFVSTHYPSMFPAMCGLAAKGEKYSGFDFFNFCNADFRNLATKYKPSYEDYFRPLPRELRERAIDLHGFALENKLRPVIGTFWKVEYKYRGVQVMCIGSAGDCESKLDVRITCTYSWDDPALINDRLAAQPAEFRQYALRHVHRCNACSTNHLGRFVTVLGKRQRVCGGGVIGFRWGNPSDGDMECIRKIIELRREIIDEIKA
ncbi:MAG: hypothetical protein ACK5LX_09410 [Oscillospiraceae bacterium]